MTGGDAVLVMILKGYPRISETFISNEIGLLETMGFTVRIVSMRQPREHFHHASVDRIKAEVIYLPEAILPALPRLVYENVMACLQAPRGYLRAIKRTVANLVRTRKSATIKHLLQAGLLCRRAVRPGENAHLHAHFAHSPTSVAACAGLISGLPVSFTGHAKDVWTQDPARLAAKVDQAAFVVTCTQANADYLRRLGTNGTPVYKVYHGIDLGLFRPGEKPVEPAPPYRLLTVARLTAKKGLDTVIAALAELTAAGLDCHLDLVGEGEERAALTEQIRRLGLAGRVRLHGALAHEAVIGLYRQAHVFTLGCRVLANGDRDGVPNVLVEAMAMGVPAAVTNVSALPELARDGATALTCPPDDPAALAVNIRRLLTEPDLRRRLTPAARETVRRDFDNVANTRILAEIFAARAGRRASSPGGGAA